MIKLGDICPLFFSPIKDRYEQDIDYVQTFYKTDKLLLQFFTDNGEAVIVKLNDLIAGTNSNLNLDTYDVNSTIKMYYVTLTGLESVYTITFDGKESEPFEFCSDSSLLQETALIRYSNKDNNSPFDNIFWINDTQQWFEFRIEAGFKPSGYSPQIDNEQYRNQRQEVINLYSVPYDTYTLSCGNAGGVPYWLGRHVNRLLCVSSVEVNGQKMVRSENSVPEMSTVSEDGQMFYFTITLEPQNNDIAGIGGAPEQSNTPSFVGFDFENLKDGDMFKYSEAKSAIVNTDRI